MAQAQEAVAAAQAAAAAAGDAASTNGDEGSNAEAGDTFSAEYVKELREEAARHRKAKADADAARADAEAKVKAFEDASKTDQDKAQEAATAAEAKATAAEDTLKARTLEYAVKLAAKDAGIVDADAAFKLLDTSSLDYDADGNPIGVKEALAALLLAKPYLAGAPAGGGSSAANGAANREPPMTAQDLGKLSAETIAAMDPAEVNRILTSKK